MARVRYMVRDVGEAVAFYTTHLGFKLEQNFGPAVALVSRDDLTLILAGPSSSAGRPMPDGRKPEAGGWNRFVIQVPDISALVGKLREGGVPFRNDIVTGPGGQQILCEDPSGNVVELFQPAATP